MTLSSKAFGLGVVLGLIVAPSCGPTSTSCDATSCSSGCCANGQCLGGDTLDSCGTAGQLCSRCQTGQSCNAGVCTSAGTGGGTGGGGGSTCNATTCPNGCCVAGACQSGATLAACGTGGLACRACEATGVCNAGVCQASLDAGTVDEQIAAARAGALDAGALPVRIVNATVTYLKPFSPDAGASDPAGFFLQGSRSGPAIFVAKDPSTLLDAGLHVGDTVSLTVTGARRFSGLRNVTEASMVSKGPAGNLANIISEVSQIDFSRAENVDAFESRLIAITGTTATASVPAGGGYRGYQLNTEGTPDAGTSVRFRVPNALADAVDLTPGCSVTVTSVPMWRFTSSTINQAQPSAWSLSELAEIVCPAPRVVSATSTSLTEATVTFDRNLDSATVTAAAFSVTSSSGALAVSAAAALSARTVRLTTATQATVTYTLTVATTVKDTRGTPLASDATSALFLGATTAVDGGVGTSDGGGSGTDDAGTGDAGTGLDAGTGATDAGTSADAGTVDAGVSCGPSTCPTGCCSNNLCFTGAASEACGSGGLACSVCTTNQTCSAQTCTTQCNATTCPGGCCQNNLCLPGTAIDECGTGGTSCSACGATQVCAQQTCTTPDAGSTDDGLSCAPSVVISQFYGGGGGAAATFRSDYVELHNLTSKPVDLSTWSVQYAAALADGLPGDWKVGLLGGTVAPYGFYLVELSAGGDGGVLTTPADFTTVAPVYTSATDGKLALVSSPMPLLGCPSGSTVVDSIGYGFANCFEGHAAPTLTKAEALTRKEACVDTNDNLNDFVKTAPAPRNSSTAAPACYCPHIVISQVYGGGDNSAAPYRTDFVELHNRTAQAIDLSQWSVQYASATSTPPTDGGSEWRVGVLGGTIAPGGYYLVATSTSNDGGVLPSPDFTTLAPVSLSATDGKVALVASTRRLRGCPSVSEVVDLVGYGLANCAETAPAPTLTKFESLIRADLNACIDTNDNSFDLVKITPAPRRSSSPANVCQ